MVSTEVRYRCPARLDSTNSAFSAHKPISSATISSKTDAALDEQFPSNGKLMPAVPKMEDDDDVVMNDIAPSANGVKRKGNNRRPSFAESESTDDDQPLVRISSNRYNHSIFG